MHAAAKRTTVISFSFLFCFVLLGRFQVQVVNVIHPEKSALLFATDSPSMLILANTVELAIEKSDAIFC